ncbi:MAG: class I SAM-dependent methyltransferase [Acidobacteria bacterium]|nr:class I SAM-dependent methyltransferase [Acidobacteriota bacterium]
MNVQPYDRILELGCGDGWACRGLASAIPQGLVIGLEISDDRVREARALSTSFENILYLWSSAEQIPWQEDFFTGALCVDSIYCFVNLDKVLRELHRVLTPGGGLWILNQLRKQDGASEQILADRSENGQLLSAEEYTTLLRQHGFEQVACRQLPDTSANLPESPPEAGALLISARKPQE